MTREDMLARLIAQAAGEGSDLVTLRAIVEEASEIGAARVLGRLAPDMAAGRGWADLAATLTARVRSARAVNLDPATLLVDMLLRIDAAAGALSRR